MYFEQRTHACACIRMVENDRKHKKMMKKVSFPRFSSCALHEPLIRMMEKVLFSSFSNVFYRFQPCERMRKHVFAG